MTKLPPQSVSDSCCLTINFYGRALSWSWLWFSCVLASDSIALFALFYHSVFDYMFHCDVIQLR